MKKVFKKIISFLLALVLSIAFSVQALATDISSNERIIIRDNVIETPLTVEQAETYAIYEISLSQIPPQNQSQPQSDQSVVNSILSLCSLDKTVQVDSLIIKEYSSNTLSNYLPYCNEILSISLMNGFLYVFYNALDGKEVTLGYSDNGLREKTVYDVATDSAVIEINGGATLYQNFRQGISVEMSDELINEIDNYVMAEDWEALYALEEIEVTADDTGTISIHPAVSLYDNTSNVIPSAVVSSVDAFESDADMLAHLQSRFPPYSKTIIGTYTRYCSALNSNVSIQVKESRDAYSRTHANWRDFVIGTAITTITTFLGGPNISVTVLILSALGVGLSAANELENHVTLCNSANYSYYGTRSGYAYDTTLYQNYVRVVNYSDRAEFHGGYTADGIFEWIIYSYPDAFNHTTSDIADTTISWYNSNISVHGYCKSYFPD